MFDAYERQGRTGRALLWRLTRTDLLNRIAAFADHDEAYRRATRTQPLDVELPFGFDGHEPVEVTLDDGRTLAFRGYADRVDRAGDGALIVSDYKTGKNKYKDITDGDPVQGGTTLQLGIYAEAALRRFGGPRAKAQYWMVNGDDERPGYEWTDARRDRFLEVVTAIADGIESGTFPAVPGDWDTFRKTNDNCTHCDFDSLCPGDRGAQAEAKVAAPELRLRDTLLAELDSEAVGEVVGERTS